MKLFALLTSFLLVSPAVAQTAREQRCYVRIINRGAPKRRVLLADTVVRHCACVNDKERLGLSTKKCPTYKFLTAAQYDKYFKRPITPRKGTKKSTQLRRFDL